LTPGQLLIVSRALKRAQSGRLLLHDFWFELAPERGRNAVGGPQFPAPSLVQDFTAHDANAVSALDPTFAPQETTKAHHHADLA
jgi:hypothetical protein